MKIHTKILTAAMVFALLITGITFISDTSDDSSADDTTYKIMLTDTLYFDSAANCNTSVEKINLQAGTEVCGYADNCLTFKKNVIITLNSSNSAKGVFIFGIADTTQYISVDESVSAFISYSGTASAASYDVGAVKKINGGNLSFTGDGTLYVSSIVPNSYAVYSSGHFYFEGRSYIRSESNSMMGGIYCKNLYCENGSFGYVNSYTNGVVMSGSEIIFDTCTIKIYGSNYGVQCSYLSKMSVKSCTADVKGANGYAFSRSPNNTSSTFTNVYGTNSLSDENSSNDIELSEIGHYKHVSMTSQITLSGDLVTTVIIAVSAIVLVIVIIAVIFIVKKKKNPAPPKTAYSPAPESVYESRTHPVSTSSVPDEVPKESSGNGRVDIMAQSMVEGRSFALIADGRIVGYIGPQMSFIDVQPGMREITIVTNDTDRKTIYQKNHMIRPGTKIIVSKKLGGFKVDVQ